MRQNLQQNYSTRDLSEFTGLGVFPYDSRDMDKVTLIQAILGTEKHESSLTREVSDDLYKQTRLPKHEDGTLFPFSMLPPTAGLRGSPRSAAAIYNAFGGARQGRAVNLSNVATSGAEMVFTEPLTFIELLRNAMVTSKLGATFFTNLVGPVAFPAQQTPGTLAWTAENPGSDVADSDMTYSRVTLSPHSAQSTTAYTRQLLTQASFDVEAIVRCDLAAINAIGIDLAAINGSGTANQPKGILNTAGIGSVAVGTNGGPPTLATQMNLQTSLYKANAKMDSPAYLVSPGIRGYMKQTPVVAGFPVMLWDGSNQLSGYPALISNQVPQTLTKGTSSGICHAMIFGNWPDLLIGSWGVLEIIVDPYRLKKQGVIEVTSFVMVDVGLRYPVSFAACLDAIPTF